MSKRALIVGINDYDFVSPLSGCINDALDMKEILERNEDGSKNYDCRLLTGDDSEPVTKKFLRQQWKELFDAFNGDILFYFSGHGTPTDFGGHLVTQDGDADDPGLSMNDLLILANNSRAKSVLLILDCCFSGDLGNPKILNDSGSIENKAQLREGVTILTASRPNQVAIEIAGQGVFTNLVISALRGGAADVRGRVSAASIYAYAEQALGAWDQRPMYKSHANCLEPVRLCNPCVEDNLLRKLPEIFPAPDTILDLDPSFEPDADPPHKENELIFSYLQKYRAARLVVPIGVEHMYYAAVNRKHCKLTPLGQFYWKLADAGRI